MAAIVINVAGAYDDRAIRQAQASLGKLGSQTKTTSKSMGASFKTMAIAGAAVGFAILKIGKGFVDVAKEAQKSREATRATEAILKSTGATAWTSAQQIGNLADSLSKKTGVDDEAIQSAQNLLLTFKNVQNAGEGQAAMFDRASAAALDLSKAGFGSLDGAAKMLGKALNDPTRGVSALSRAGVTFTQQQKDQIKAMQESGNLLGAQALIMQEVESQVGGVAEAVASPFEKLQTMLGNFKEQLGQAVLPAFESIINGLQPLLDSLAGPLGQLMGQVATNLSGIFQQIAPLLPPLATALGQVVALVGQSLMQAIQNLLPAVVPLLQLIAGLASQLGPILAPILAKVSQLLQAVLLSVMPLLGPLADLLVNIFAQAAPVIDLVVGVLLQVVQALQPVFAAVSQLIPPLSQLVTVIFAALMPILQPLLPIISLLANVLGGILVKAIAVLMMGLGKLIEGWSKLAPFMLNNVVRPVVDFFMGMVGDVLEGAEAMLGWIPGLGDQLHGAVQQFEGLRQGVSDGIAQAADTVSREGSRIGQEMTDAGLAMFQDPNAPQAAGSTFGSNIVNGMQSQQGSVYAAGQALGQSGVAGYTSAWAAGMAGSGLPSPSVTITGGGGGGGGGTTKGGGKGKDTKKQAKRTLADLQKELGREAAQESRRRSLVNAGLPKALADSIINGDGWRRVSGEVLKGGKDAVRGIVETWKKTGAGRDFVRQAAQDAAKATTEAAQAAAKAAKEQHAAALKQAREVLDGFKEQAKGFRDYVQQTVQSLADFGSVAQLQGDGMTSPNAAGIVKQMQERLAQVRKFGGYLRDLKKLGLNNASLQQIIAAGPEAGSQIAAALLAEGARAISQVNTLEKQFAAASATVGTIGAESQFGITAGEAKALRGSTVNVSSLTVNLGDGVAGADRARLRREVQTAINEAINALARESTRTGGR